jgi:hypothetical protein
MKRNTASQWKIVAATVLAAALTASASTQHYIGKVVSGQGASAKVVSTQISYISAHPPIGKPEMYAPEEARIFMVDGWYCDRETFLAAVQPGRRLHLRNNRHQPITYGLYSTKPFAAEGIILDADPDSRRVTVRHMVDKNQRKTTKQTYTLPADGVLRYEGEEATPAEALKKGRHVRAHPARKQTILAITPEVYLDTVAERNKAWTNLKEFTWANEGYFAGYYHNKLFYTGEPFRDGGGDGLVNTCQPGASITDGLFTSKCLINGSFVTTAAAFRPGGRALYVPDPIHSRQRASNVILHPTDNGHVEGRIESVDGDKLRLRVTRCPTGRARDLEQETVTIRLADDAVYHLNGKPGASREEALQEGNTVRVLPAWSGAMLVRDLDADKAKVSGYGLVNRVTATVEKPVAKDGPAEFHLRFGHVLFSPLSPAQYVDATFIWKHGKVHELKLFNERFPGNWKSKNAKLEIDFDGDKLSGRLEANFFGGTVTDHGRDGLYRFIFEGRVRNNVVIGRMKKITVDGTDASDIDAEHVGRLDSHLGGTVRVGPAEGKTGLYRLVLHGNRDDAFDPVVYLPRDENGWGEGLAVFGGNRWGHEMAVDPAKLKLTPKGLAGSLRVKLAATLLDNVSRPQWKTYHLSAEATGEDAPRFRGRYRMVFGNDPLLWLGPGGTIVRE